MKTTGKVLVAALAAAGLAMAGQALADGGRHGGGSGHYSGNHGGGNWRGGASVGHWRGGGHWGGGHWGGSRWYGPRVGFYFGVPVVLGLGYWGSSYWGYPYDTVVYREVVREPEVIETVREPAPADFPPQAAQPAPGAGPLYMNYCESAREYYPKVARCPEGWKFVTPTN